ATPVFALSKGSTSNNTENLITNTDEEIIVPIFYDLDSSNVIYTVEEDTEVSIVETNESMTLIEFFDVENNEIVEGFVDNDYLLYLSATDSLHDSSNESDKTG